MKEWLHPGRRLLVMFFALTLILVVALAWMSWQLIVQDRALATQRMQERRESIADLAVVELQKRLSDVEGQLAVLSPADAQRYGASLPSDNVLLVIRSGDFAALGRTHLLFYPDAGPAAAAPAALFAAADRLEFRDRDYVRACSLLRNLARNSDPAIKAEALMRLGRNLAKSESMAEALAAYDRLAQLGSVPAGGLPSGLAAHEARLLLLRKQQLDGAVKDEERTICSGLNAGAWKIGRTAFDFYAGEACGKANPGADPAALALSAAADAMWDEWQAGGGAANAAGCRSGWYEGRPVLAVWRSSGSTMVALLSGAAGVQSLYLKPLQPRLDSASALLALTDADGRAVWGATPNGGSAQAVRLASATQLPWTLHVIATTQAAMVSDHARGRWILTGSLTLLLLVLAGSYFIGRAAAREVAVARLQSDFVASVSHEFRTPITALRQLSELLASGRVANDEDRNEYYRALSRESERMHRLVEGLLNFGRLESGAIRYRFERLDAIEFVRSVVAEFRSDAEAHGYQIELVDNGSRPVSADRAALGCAVSNLLDNAVKYSPECSTVWVEVAQAARRTVAIRVRDRGIGIPPAEQKQIFEKFVRGAAAQTGSIRGAGVGLAMARQIVEAHHGEIRLESRPGEGSTFTVLLPELS